MRPADALALRAATNRAQPAGAIRRRRLAADDPKFIGDERTPMPCNPSPGLREFLPDPIFRPGGIQLRPQRRRCVPMALLDEAIGEIRTAKSVNRAGKGTPCRYRSGLSLQSAPWWVKIMGS